MLVFEDVSSNLLPLASMEDSIPRLANPDKPLNSSSYKLPWLWWVLTARVKQQLTPTSEHDVLGTHLKQTMSPNLTSQHKQQLPHWHVIGCLPEHCISAGFIQFCLHFITTYLMSCLQLLGIHVWPCVWLAGPHLCFVFLNWRPPGLPVPNCLRRMLSILISI